MNLQVISGDLGKLTFPVDVDTWVSALPLVPSANLFLSNLIEQDVFLLVVQLAQQIGFDVHML